MEKVITQETLEQVNEGINNAYFAYGYIYAKAEGLKESTEYYKNWEINEIVLDLIKSVKNNK